MARPACPAPITATSTRAGRSEVPRAPLTPASASGFREFRPFITCISVMRTLPSALVVELDAGNGLDGDDRRHDDEQPRRAGDRGGGDNDERRGDRLSDRKSTRL